MDEKAILFEVLTIIGYKDSKMDFINKFFSYIYIEAIAQISTSLSDEESDQLRKELEENEDDAEGQKAVLLKHLSKEKFDALLTEITQSQFTDYLEAIYPTLSPEKKQELDTFLTSLQKN
ncbi:hypothetical protein KBD09_02410 [Candidatus Woesebacteria bacterium]|nr:hypothetical protein [Candidatus Woesebacteria bacterium]